MKPLSSHAILSTKTPKKESLNENKKVKNTEKWRMIEEKRAEIKKTENQNFYIMFKTILTNLTI